LKIDVFLTILKRVGEKGEGDFQFLDQERFCLADAFATVVDAVQNNLEIALEQILAQSNHKKQSYIRFKKCSWTY
jgi:hypothetical protein